ncbi:MAG: hypothetical protein V1917_02525 [Candidatus Gottesmanbacteria bacterium]
MKRILRHLILPLLLLLFFLFAPSTRQQVHAACSCSFYVCSGTCYVGNIEGTCKTDGTQTGWECIYCTVYNDTMCTCGCVETKSGGYCRTCPTNTPTKTPTPTINITNLCEKPLGTKRCCTSGTSTGTQTCVDQGDNEYDWGTCFLCGLTSTTCCKDATCYTKCACASTTTIGNVCTDSCGNSCAGTKCEADGSSCNTDTCCGDCVNQKCCTYKSCACAATTYKGSTCNDCGSSCSGTLCRPSGTAYGGSTAYCCSGCSTNGICTDAWCNTSVCPAGCYTNTCSGSGPGVCKPYCDAAHGSTTAPSQQCPYGCIPSITGGSCIPPPTPPPGKCVDKTYTCNPSATNFTCTPACDADQNCVSTSAACTPPIIPTLPKTCSQYGPVYQCNDYVTSYKCMQEGSTWLWSFYSNCTYKCARSTNTPLVKCALSSYYGTPVGQCCANNDIPYCRTDCTPCANPVNTYEVKCWQNLDTYLFWKGDSNNPDYAPISSVCVQETQCAACTNPPCEFCTDITETCGGDAFCTTPEVSHIDNCNHVFCGPTCVPTSPTDPTPTPCVPSCSCATECIGSGNYCTGDCGATCPGTKACSGTLSAKAVLAGADTSCNTLGASANALINTSFSFSPAVSPASKIQTGSTPVSWTGVTTTGTTNYAVNAIPPGQYIQANVCVSTNGGTTWTQASAGTLADGGSLLFVVGYKEQTGWVQTQSGDVYAAARLVSSIPDTATNPYFVFDDPVNIGSAGIVTYGTTYDFSLSTANRGNTKISTKGWLTKQTYAPVHWYDQFASRMDIPGTATAITPDPLGISKPTCTKNPCIFYADGDLVTETTRWDYGSIRQVIIFVNGNLTIKNPIIVANGGFFAFIVNGNITIDPAVGRAWNNATKSLDGIYIATTANHTGTFKAGASTNLGTERLNIRGMVIADKFLLERDLGINNNTSPAENFIFNPQLLFTMPDEMKEIPYVWQEVAP